MPPANKPVSSLRDIASRPWAGKVFSATLTIALILVFFMLIPPTRLIDPWKTPLVICVITSYAFCLVAYFHSVKIDAIGVCGLGYFFVLLLDALIAHSSITSCFKYNFGFTCILLLARALFPRRKKELLWAASILLGLYSTYNVLDMFGFPTGKPLFYDGYIFGFLNNRNAFSRFYLAAIGCSALLDYYKGRRFSPPTAALFIVAFVQAIMMPSATSTVALAFFTVAFVAIHAQNLRKLFTAKYACIAYLVAFVALVILRLQGLLGFLVEDIFHKNITFTGRTPIWDTVIERLGAGPFHFVFGYYGTRDSLVPSNPEIVSAHNGILEIAYQAGILGVIAGVSLFVIAAIRLYRSRSEYPSALVSIIIGAFLIVGLMEHITCGQLWLFLGIAACFGGTGVSKTAANSSSQEGSRPVDTLSQNPPQDDRRFRQGSCTRNSDRPPAPHRRQGRHIEGSSRQI